jgi:DNA-binding response OmpR family regulator
MEEPGSPRRMFDGLPAARLAQVRQLSDPLRLLICEPDAQVIAQLAQELAPLNVEVLASPDGARALLDAGLERPHVLLLPGALPCLHIADAVRALKQVTNTYVVIGAGEGEIDNVAEAMTAGADRVVPRPYHGPQVADVLRDAASRFELAPAVLRAGLLTIDPLAYEVRLGDQVIPMPVRELEVLVYLVNNQDRIVTVAELREVLWASEPLSPKSNAVAVTVLHLRARFGESRGSDMIRTIRRLGYRFHPPHAETS